MALLVLYEDIANPEPSDVALDITDRVRVGSLDVTQNAEEGSVAISTVTIDDPDGDLEIVGYRKFVVYETDGEAGVSQLTYNGFIVDRRVIRGPNRTGAGRQWVCSVVDTNCLLEFRIMTGEDADRPAETDIDRLDWLLAESEMSRIPNHDYYNTTGPVNMDAADYRGQRAVDVVNDCAQQSGKNYFAFCIDDPSAPPLDDAPGKTIFWYDFADSTEYSSTLSLSNVLADILADPDTCFEISQDTELTRDPSRVYSGAYVRYDGGEEYEEDLDISNEFTRRDAVVPADNVKTSAKATARALRYLADMNTEEDRITTSVLLPAAKVNLIREGMRIPFKATHLPGFDQFVWQRILRRTVKQVTEEYYLLTLTLGSGGGATGEFVQDATAWSDGEGVDVVLDFDPTPGNLLVAFLNIRETDGSTPSQAGWNAVPDASGIHLEPSIGANGTLFAYWKIAEASDTTTIHLGEVISAAKSGYVIEITGPTTLVDSATENDQPPTANIAVGPVSPSGSGNFAIGAFIVGGHGTAGGNTHADVDITAPYFEVHSSAANGETDPDANLSLPPMYCVGYQILPDSSNTTLEATYETGGFALGPWGGILLVFA